MRGINVGADDDGVTQWRPASGGAADTPGLQLVDLRDLLRSALRLRWVVAGLCAGGIGVAALVTAFQDREFESGATIFVASNQHRNSLGREVGSISGLRSLGGFGQAAFSTELTVLESRHIAELVVDSLALHVKLVEPRMSRADAVEVLEAPRGAPLGVFELSREPNGSYSVRPRHAGFAGEFTRRVDGSDPFRLGDVTLRLAPGLLAASPARIIIEVASFELTVNSLRKNLAVGQPRPGGQVVSIRARSTDSVAAAEIPNVAAKRFIEYQVQASQLEARGSVQFLQDQVVTYGEQLRDAEARLQAYQEQARVVSPSDQATQQVRQLADVQARRDLLVAERTAIDALLERAAARSATAEESSPYRELAAFPVFLSNGAVQGILRTLTELENQRAELLVRRTPENIDVQRIQRRIGELELQLFQTARSYRDGLVSQIVSFDETLSQFGDQLGTIPEQHVTYARLAREKRLLEDLYTLLQTRLKEAEIRAAEAPRDIRFLDAALVPRNPVAPRPTLNLALGAILGLMLGTGAAVLAAVIDPKARSRAAVVSASGLPVLGMIPRIPGDGSARRRVIPWRWTRRLPSNSGATSVPALVVQSEPQSGAAEAYRTLRANLTLPEVDGVPRVIVICSTVGGEGKSTSAANLAVTLAHQGLRTLLIDCDLRKPDLHRVFAVEASPGITELLNGQTPLEAAIREVDLEHGWMPLHILPAGAPTSNPAELLGSRQMRALLAKLREQYDIVIVDAAPMGSAADAAVLGTMADSTILVTRTTITHKRAVTEAVAHMRQLRVRMGGVVMNDVDLDELKYQRYAYGNHQVS